MTWSEEVEVTWPVEVLTALGFTQAEAQRLHTRLPPIEAGILASHQAWGNALCVDGRPHAVATVIWLIHDLGARAAVRLAHTGVDVLDLIVILDAVHAAHPDRIWTHAKVELAEAWARSWPRMGDVAADRLAAYIAARIRPTEAVAFEAGHSAGPTETDLAFLAALHQSGGTP